MIRRLVIQLTFLILLLIPISLAYTFGNSNINVTVFDSLAAQSLISSQLNLSYTVSSLVYFKSNVLNLTLPPVSLYFEPFHPTTVPPVSGSSGPSKVSSKQPVTTPTLTDLTKELKIGDKISFNIKGNEEHNIALIAVDYRGKEASYIITSEPIKFTLAENKYRLFDLNNNTFIDLNITLENLKQNIAVTKIQEIAEPEPLTTISTSSIQPELEEITGEIIKEEPITASETTSKDPARLWTLIIGSLAILAIVITIILYPKSRKKKSS